MIVGDAITALFLLAMCVAAQTAELQYVSLLTSWGELTL
ncbi:hypothetical protein CRENPOLYSF1_1120012 [Crenothrix polyspora]|uniref:Uncharacterized protein n=1 Tax=Crenothrix polyspora TaxID=360316 RepID=A0A1R4GZT4_9GAMM|nr:hypothetical protein CRENPOLYSF1_1120012 [Crenothrix polyspora]